MNPLEHGAGALILTDARRAAGFRARAPFATVLTDAAALDGIESRFDSALVDGVLEEERWDRWVLQRVHRSLRMDGTIVVVVPPLVSFGSAADLRFLAYALRQVVCRIVKRWRPRFDLQGRVRRRYSFSRLARKMESVGYTALQSGAANGSWWARRSTLTARKTCSLPGAGVTALRDARSHGERYARHYPQTAAAREAWLGRFPEFRGLASRALAPAEWRAARVLVLAPHPDDELIGCGGTLCALLEAGAAVTILHATDGCRLESLRDLPEQQRKSARHDEARRVASRLGARIVLWRHEDGGLPCDSATIGEMAGLLEELRPTHVFTPFLGDCHQDHRNLSRILAGALGAICIAPQVLQYEVWSLVPANLYCDVTQQAETVERLLLLYESAMQVENFVRLCESRDFARALELTGKPGYVEAYFSTTAADFRRLAECDAD